MQVLSRQRGVSLIEVMMAVLIFSIGLIGLAGLVVMSTRSNHAAYLRTQVTFLAGNMADRMSANPAGVWKGSYNSAYPVAAATVGCGSGAACNSAGLAVHDQQLWSSQLKTFLPNPIATIACDGVTKAGYDPTPQLAMRPPYGGNCIMTIKWSERDAGDATHRGNLTQNFIWKFQP
ncbi:MAG: type IV pilus modification protein PilV [Pseudomonadota bacterium]|jgi:type IV pilus assembly protein PilV